MLLFHMLAHWQNHLDKLICQELKSCEFGYCQQLIKTYLRRWKYKKNRHSHQLQSKSISQAVHFSVSSTHYPPNRFGPVPSLRQKTCNLKKFIKNNFVSITNQGMYGHRTQCPDHRTDQTRVARYLVPSVYSWFYLKLLVSRFSLYLLVRVCMACPWPRTVRSLRTANASKSRISIIGLNRTLA